MNNGKLQAKQEKLKSLHCPSTQSSFFNSRVSSLNNQLPCLVSNFPAPKPDQSPNSPSIRSKHNSKRSTPSSQNTDESEIRSSQRLFIDISTELLRQGQSVRFRAPGLSMHPAIKEGETITVIPVSPLDIKRGDILLYIVGRKVIAHRVVRIKGEKNEPTSHSAVNFSANSSNNSATHFPNQFSVHNHGLIFILRGDASATCDEQVEAQQVLGKVVSVEKEGRSIDLYSRGARMFRFAYAWASRLKRLILRILKANRGVGLTFGGTR